MAVYQRLTERVLASGVTPNDLIHIVITGDTSQDPDGSSYKASIKQVFDAITGYCITDLYVRNVHGCSPITVWDDTYFLSSKVIQSPTPSSYTALTSSYTGITSAYDTNKLVFHSVVNLNTGNKGAAGFAAFGDLDPTGTKAVFFSYCNDGYIKTGTIGPVGNDFYQNKLVIKGENGVSGTVINPNGGNPNAILWLEMNGASTTKFKGDGNPNTTSLLGLGLNPDGTEDPKATLQIGGTGTTGTFRYIDGNQSNGYVLTSNSNGKASWQPPFTGNTSASCITDLYVSNLNSCSPLHIQPTNLGNVFISENGGTVGIGTTSVDVIAPETLTISAKSTTSYNIITAKSNVNNYTQLNIINKSYGVNSSADVVATNNTGNESTNFIDMGINGSNFSGNIGIGNDAYLYSTGRELYIGNANTGATGNIRFFAGNIGSSTQMFISGGTGNVGIGTTLPTQKLHVSGNTKIDGGLTSNTISATTYQNLPTDVRVTGATYSNNTFTYTNNTGGTFNVLFNTVTGLTVNGNLTVTGNTSVQNITGQTLTLSNPTLGTDIPENYLTRDITTGEIKVNQIPGPTTYGLFAQTGNSTVVSATTVESSLIDGGVGTLSVPANGFKIGDSFRADFGGLLSSKNADTMRIRVKTGSVILADSGTQTLNNTTNDVWQLSINFTIRKIGTAGNAEIVSLGVFHSEKQANGTPTGFAFNTVNKTTFNTTVSNTLAVTVQFSSNSALNSIYSDIFVLNKIY
jgi:hypothetical protein